MAPRRLLWQTCAARGGAPASPIADRVGGQRFKPLNRAGVRSVRFHDLRHTFGTRMAAAGVRMRTPQEWIGDAEIKTTLIYAHYAPSPNEAAMTNSATDDN
ncbi:MAG TPA: tyrosine-type recombinase/integrase [Solirubrobacteraceae bacterium]